MRNKQIQWILGFCISIAEALSYCPCVQAQKPPNVCVNPPAPYEMGGSFKFVIEENGMAYYKDQVCLGNKITPIGLVNDNTEASGNHRYLLDVKDDIFIPKPSELSPVDNFTISKTNAGLYWVMQIEEVSGKFRLNCRALTIQAPPPPKALSGLLATVEADGNLTISTPEEPAMGRDFALFLAPTSTFLDLNPTPFWKVSSLDAQKQSYCFTTQFFGECENLSEISEPICTPFIEENLNYIEWDQPKVGADWEIVNYQIQELDLLGTTTKLVETRDLRVPISLVRGELPKTVRLAVNLRHKVNGQDEVIYSNTLDFSPIQPLYFPTAFTPNQDGINDTWGPVSALSPISIEMTILDRLGRVVFQSNQWPNTQWDGKDNGVMLPTGVYTYRVKYQWLPGVFRTVQGDIQLLR